ncbi:MAG: LysR family transcriptional regulator [Clostridia bacterium]|nr:LysR family transcriptional regulator [Clostridia bacterium]
MFKNKEYVLAIVNEGGFSKAAEKLYISQPSLSATIKRIEEKLTAPIFDRTTTPITLTEIGKEYVNHALEIERMERDFERYISDCVNLSAGEVKIGGSSLFSSFMLPEMISKFNEKYPRVSIKIFENNTKNLISELAAGNLDIIIDNTTIKNENISSIVYTSETILLAVPKNFEVNSTVSKYALTAADVKAGKHLDEKYAVELREFIKLPFILLNTENDTGKRAAELFKKHKLTPTVHFRLDQQMTAYNISCSGLGISFISDTLVKNIDSSESILYYRLKDAEAMRNIYFYQKSNRYNSIACQKFVEFNMAKNG